jgi:hypothetical protein
MVRLLAFVSVLQLSSGATAQTGTDSLRSIYIQEYPDRFGVWPVLKQRELFFSVRDADRKKQKVDYRPNNSFGLGIGAYLFEVLIEATFAIPLNEKRKEVYGDSDVRDWQANVVARKFAADVYYQKYSGFYVNDKRVVIPDGTPFPQRADINTRNYGLGGVYVLNHRKFSLRSAFNYVDRQLSSRGSLLIGGTLNAFKVEADSALLPAAALADMGEGSRFDFIRNSTVSLSAGYSYTWIWRKFFANATVAAGPAKHWVKYNESGTSRYSGSLNALTSWRLGAGYNSDRFFGGLSFITQSRGATFGDILFSNTNSTLRIVAGYRFKEIGLLKKRAVEFLPMGL